MLNIIISPSSREILVLIIFRYTFLRLIERILEHISSLQGMVRAPEHGTSWLSFSVSEASPLKETSWLSSISRLRLLCRHKSPWPRLQYSIITAIFRVNNDLSTGIQIIVLVMCISELSVLVGNVLISITKIYGTLGIAFLINSLTISYTRSEIERLKVITSSARERPGYTRYLIFTAITKDWLAWKLLWPYYQT